MQEEIDENEEISGPERKRENKKVNKTKAVIRKRKMKREQVKESYREMVFKSDGQAYAQVTSVLGDDRVGLNCFDDHQSRIGHISGRMRSHHEIVKLGDIVLIGLREFQPDKADLLHVYTPDEAMNIDELKSIFDDLAQRRIGMKGAVFDAMHRFDEANAKARDDPFEMYEEDDQEDMEDEEEEEEIDEEKVENL